MHATPRSTWLPRPLAKRTAAASPGLAAEAQVVRRQLRYLDLPLAAGPLMNARFATSVWTSLTLAGLASPVIAQRHHAVFLGAGLAGPTDGFASDVDPGWQISGMLEIPLGAEIASLRIELAYVHFGASLAGQAPRMVPLLVTLAAELGGRTVRPFLVGGTGMYYFMATNPEFTDNKFGVNLGGGARWRRLSFEGRYHSVFDRGDTYWALTMSLRL